MQDSHVSSARSVTEQIYHLHLCWALSACKGLSTVSMLYWSPSFLQTCTVSVWQAKNCSSFFECHGYLSLGAFYRWCYGKWWSLKQIKRPRLYSTVATDLLEWWILSYMGSTCCREKGVLLWMFGTGDLNILLLFLRSSSYLFMIPCHKWSDLSCPSFEEGDITDVFNH